MANPGARSRDCRFRPAGHRSAGHGRHAECGEDFSRLAISPGQAKLDERIKPDLHDDLDRIIDSSNISERALNRMETWAAALSLASAQTRSLGLDSSGGVEKKLTARFEKAGKPIEALETIELQLGYFDKLPEEQQRQMLTSVLEDSDDAQQAFELLFNAWMTGDLEHIVTLSDTGILKDPKTREYLLVARNLDWAEQLDKRLQRPGTSLVAVGAAHLAGPDAVQAMLAKRGYKIEKFNNQGAAWHIYLIGKPRWSRGKTGFSRFRQAISIAIRPAWPLADGYRPLPGAPSKCIPIAGARWCRSR
ncbi:hypothetical protein C8024_17115 [Sphingopyxis sp. BSNA05]|nr:TraB/GumN family protein [Sphingopyxis sp. BSNA05]NRD90791.1 hypothetical protein [Sphingopyxis sp. BSNA05]